MRRKKVEILLNRTVPERTVAAGFRQRAAIFANLLRIQIVDIGVARFDQMFGPLVELFEIVRGKQRLLAPIESQPAQVLLNGVDIFLFLLDRIGVIQSKIAATAKFTGHTEVQRDRLGVPDVEIAVGFGWKSRDHRIFAPGRKVVANDIADKVIRAFALGSLGFRIALSHLVRFSFWPGHRTGHPMFRLSPWRYIQA